jgi:hypothetical protein
MLCAVSHQADLLTHPALPEGCVGKNKRPAQAMRTTTTAPRMQDSVSGCSRPVFALLK